MLSFLRSKAVFITLNHSQSSLEAISVSTTSGTSRDGLVLNERIVLLEVWRMTNRESQDWTWKKATSLRLAFWPDAFILLLLMLVNGIIFKTGEYFLPDQLDLLGFVIAFPIIVFFGRIWLRSIERRNRQPEEPADESTAG
ncbi:MAG: hypothetical protein CL681_01830 [Blastopirellula sp.]|nr:hypothetical protein [Blastopirellula sp.]